MAVWGVDDIDVEGRCKFRFVDLKQNKTIRLLRSWSFLKIWRTPTALMVFKDTYKPCCCSRTLGEKTQTSVWFVPASYANATVRSTHLTVRWALL